ncbi:MAG TPA: flagellar filament capping protein FliD [Candidatus Sulfotelmatobacter sp.]|nr:flagellar filament capping protein FliD [Candidatus Sulfotelmatobacter sp.]
MADGVDLSLSGLASGFDWKTLVAQLAQAERAPETRWLTQQRQIQQRNTAFGNLKTQLTTLQTRVAALKDATLYDSRTTQASDSTVASASAASGAVTGVFTFNITQLATASTLSGTPNVGNPLNSSSDVSSLILATAGFPTPVTGGTFTVNGQQISIATSDNLKGVFDKIATATNNQVTASYDPTSDKIKLSSTSPIVLGSATDTSNFLQVARLYNNGTGSVSSSLALGSIRLSATLANAGFTTPLSDGGSGAGQFTLNGVPISFNASQDTVADVLNRINSSAAGVTASYDVIQDRFVLASKAAGDMGIALQDTPGSNFLAATGLASGTLSRGKNLLFSVNGGATLTSQSNTITDASSGITGLSVTALKENASVTVTVASDTAKIKGTIQSFVDAYNQIQSFIDSQTASSTDAQGKVTAGILAGDSQAKDISSSLRSTAFSLLSGAAGAPSGLAALGYQTSGYNNSLTLSGSDQLDSALANHLPDLKQLFSDTTNGLAVKLDNLLTRTIGTDGSLIAHQNSLTKQSASIDGQIAALEKSIQAEQARMTKEFVAMETAQAKINQQLAYLTKTFSSQ